MADTLSFAPANCLGHDQRGVAKRALDPHGQLIRAPGTLCPRQSKTPKPSICCTPLAPEFSPGLSAPSALMARRSMPQPLSTDASDYVLLHRDTGCALYTTRATELEIHRANQKLKQAGQRSRYVPARQLGHHSRGQS